MQRFITFSETCLYMDFSCFRKQSYKYISFKCVLNHLDIPEHNFIKFYHQYNIKFLIFQVPLLYSDSCPYEDKLVKGQLSQLLLCCVPMSCSEFLCCFVKGLMLTDFDIKFGSSGYHLVKQINSVSKVHDSRISNMYINSDMVLLESNVKTNKN